MTTWQKIQNFFFVTLIAVLIWFFAEGENTKDKRENLAIQFVPAPGQSLIISPDAPQNVSVHFVCTTAQYNAFRKIQSQSQGIGIPIAADANLTVILRDMLNANRDIKEAGVSILDTDPPTFLLQNIERLVPKTLPVVVVPLSGDLRYATPPTPEPAQVSVMMPESLANRTEGLWVEAKLPPASLANIEENVPRTLDVPLTLSDAFWKNFKQKFGDPGPRNSTTLSSNAAKLTFTVRKLTEKVKLPIVQIQFTAAPSEFSRFAVTFDSDQQVLQDVTCVGPVETIERIRQKDPNAEVYAYLKLSTEDLEQAADKGPRTAPLKLFAPTGVRADPPLPIARFTVTRLAPTAPGIPGSPGIPPLPPATAASPPMSVLPQNNVTTTQPPR